MPGDLPVPLLPVVDLGPGHPVVAGELGEASASIGLVEADPDHLEPLRPVVLEDALEVRQLRPARSAPGRPEVEQDEPRLAVAREAERPAVRRPRLERCRRPADLQDRGRLRLGDALSRLDDPESRPARREAGQLDRRPLDVERLADVEALAARVEATVAVHVEEERDAGASLRVGAAEVPGALLVVEHRPVRLPPQRHRPLVSPLPVAEERRGLIAAHGGGEPVDRQLHRGRPVPVPHLDRRGPPVRRLASRARRGGPDHRPVVGQIAVSVGVHEDPLLAALGLVDRHRDLGGRLPRTHGDPSEDELRGARGEFPHVRRPGGGEGNVPGKVRRELRPAPHPFQLQLLGGQRGSGEGGEQEEPSRSGRRVRPYGRTALQVPVPHGRSPRDPTLSPGRTHEVRHPSRSWPGRLPPGRRSSGFPSSFSPGRWAIDRPQTHRDAPRPGFQAD